VEVDLDPVVATAALAVPVDLLVVAVTSAAVVLAGPVGQAVLMISAAVAPVAPVDLADRTSAAVAPVVLADRTSTATVPVVLVGPTSAAGVLVTSTETATTSDRGPMMPSAASAANRGAMEPRLGAGALRPGQAGAGRSLHQEGSGTRAQ
jgi:hypothetical protein